MKTRTAKRWRFQQPDNDTVRSISSECGISELLARVLVNRKITTTAEAREFLSPTLSTLHDPFTMKGMETAAYHLAEAITTGVLIGIYSDMDCDGTGGGAVLRKFIDDAGGQAINFIPHRVEHGYGVHRACLEELARNGVDLVVTVDCGITAVAEAAYCRELGMQMIITDHHTPPQELPQTLAIVNPHQEGCVFPFKYLAGAGVAFYLVMATRKLLREGGRFRTRPEPDIRRYLDMACISTIGDLVSLTGENRKLTSYGLSLINRKPSPGIAALKVISGLDTVTSGQVSFILAPKLNAAGRMSTASHALDLLLSEEEDEALTAASLLHEFNIERQAAEAEVLEAALEAISSDDSFDGSWSTVVACSGAHPGVVGIVGSKLVEIFHRPTVVIAVDENGIGKGSCRSIPGYDIHAGLQSCSEHLVKFGGHKAAAGLTIKAENIPAFRAAFEKHIRSKLSEQDLVPEIKIDAEVSVRDVTFKLHEELQVLEPHGIGNPKTVFASTGLKVISQRTLKEKHLKLLLGKGNDRIEAIGFNMASDEKLDTVDVAYSVDVNEWNGRRSIQLQLKDVRPTGG